MKTANGQILMKTFFEETNLLIPTQVMKAENLIKNVFLVAFKKKKKIRRHPVTVKDSLTSFHPNKMSVFLVLGLSIAARQITVE